MVIHMLPAFNGDCILVEFASSHYILIDGGYADTYKVYLLSKLKEIADKGGVIDLVVVTHIDSDHISGIIKLFEEDELPIPIKEIWYNGYRHVQSNAKVSKISELFVHGNICKEVQGAHSKKVSARQGCTLSRLIQRKHVLWNTPVEGGTIRALLSYSIGDAVLHVLSPNDDNIRSVEEFWQKRLIKDGLLSKEHSCEYWDDAFEFCLSKDKPGFHFHKRKVSKSYDFLNIMDEDYVPDTSPTNGSSIAFILETEGKKVLFLGDAHAETIVDSLKKIYKEGSFPIKFDAVKLSHHGSFDNNSPELLDMITSNNWLISTNGDKYNHPDLPTLAHVIANGHNDNVKLYFNYDLNVGKELMKKDYHKEYDFQIISSDGEDGITITF